MWNGTPTLGGQILQGLGLSPNAAELVYGLSQLAPAAGEAIAAHQSGNGLAKANAELSNATAKGIPHTIKEEIDVSVTSEGKANTATYPRLKNQLTAEEVSEGHAFEKHVIDGKEFDDLGITTRKEFQNFIDQIISNPSIERRYAKDGKMFYIDYSTKTIVIKGPKGEATAFRPDYGDGIGWEKYIKQRAPRK